HDAPARPARRLVAAGHPITSAARPRHRHAGRAGQHALFRGRGRAGDGDEYAEAQGAGRRGRAESQDGRGRVPVFLPHGRDARARVDAGRRQRQSDARHRHTAQSVGWRSGGAGAGGWPDEVDGAEDQDAEPLSEQRGRSGGRSEGGRRVL
ncbi:hypothetical protein LTR16_007386, partial [Cryomyces antarcticus]